MKKIYKVFTRDFDQSTQEIALVWTRDFTLTWADWWSRDMHPRLVEVIGKGVPSQLSFYNGRLLETYRLTCESQTFIEAVVKKSLTSNILSNSKINRFISLNKEIRNLIKQRGVITKSDFNKVQKLVSEMYPWYTISYLLPQEQWAGKLLEKYPLEGPEILDRLIYARSQCEGTIEWLIEYWRRVAGSLLVSRKILPDLASFVTIGEIEKMLANKNFSLSTKILEKRSKSFIYFKGVIYTGITKAEFFTKHGFFCLSTTSKSNRGEIKGTVACAGPTSIRGKVSVIMRNDEVKNFEPGNILITVMTNPFFIPIMKKAKAIITDEGGITCHAAIVSRELKIPCVIGTKIATKIFKDGDLVEVNANRGIVKKLQNR